MNRRSALGYILGLGSLLGARNISKKSFEIKTIFAPFIVRSYYISALFPEAQFSSTDEFWSAHYEKEGDDSNRIFQNLGLLIGKKSYLIDSKTIVLEQTFKVRLHYLAHQKFKEIRSSKNQIEKLIHFKSELQELDNIKILYHT